MKVSKKDREEAISSLKDFLGRGDKVYGIVRSVARSGMSRTIDFYVVKDNRLVYLTGYMSKVLNIACNKQGALKVQGCGMDMIFACVYELSMSLFGDGYSLKHDSL